MNIRPLHDRVLAKRIETEEQLRGAIVVPNSAREKSQEAKVTAVGPGKATDDGSRFPLDVRVGDRILVGKYSGSEITIEGEELVILSEEEIFAVLEP